MVLEFIRESIKGFHWSSMICMWLYWNLCIQYHCTWFLCIDPTPFFFLVLLHGQFIPYSRGIIFHVKWFFHYWNHQTYCQHYSLLLLSYLWSGLIDVLVCKYIKYMVGCPLCVYVMGYDYRIVSKQKYDWTIEIYYNIVSVLKY